MKFMEQTEIVTTTAIESWSVASAINFGNAPFVLHNLIAEATPAAACLQWPALQSASVVNR